MSGAVISRHFILWLAFVGLFVGTRWSLGPDETLTQVVWLRSWGPSGTQIEWHELPWPVSQLWDITIGSLWWATGLVLVFGLQPKLPKTSPLPLPVFVALTTGILAGLVGIAGLAVVIPTALLLLCLIGLVTRDYRGTLVLGLSLGLTVAVVNGSLVVGAAAVGIGATLLIVCLAIATVTRGLCRWAAGFNPRNL